MNRIPRILVTAVAARAAYVEYYRQHLPHVEPVWCTGHGAMVTFERAWIAAAQDPVLILTDDLCLAENFLQIVLEALEETGGGIPINFFSMRKRHAEGSRYEPGSAWMCNPCYYLPAGLAARIFQFSARWQNRKGNENGDDVLMRDFFVSAKIGYFQKIPCPVQHSPIVSAIDSRRSSRRQTPYFSRPQLNHFPDPSLFTP